MLRLRTVKIAELSASSAALIGACFAAICSRMSSVACGTTFASSSDASYGMVVGMSTPVVNRIRAHNDSAIVFVIAAIVSDFPRGSTSINSAPITGDSTAPERIAGTTDAHAIGHASWSHEMGIHCSWPGRTIQKRLTPRLAFKA